MIAFKYPLPRLAAALRAGGPVKIVAMGSSSTAGRGDVVPYPHRLEMHLRTETGNPMIDVLNRGRGGEEADKQLPRFDTEIFAEKPSLVIWQVGTNAVFHKDDYNINDVAAKIAEGVARVRAHADEMDVLLIDPQYVTAMLRDEKAELSERMVALIAEVARQARVNMFRRWALMRHWHIHNNIGFDRMLDPTDDDLLHHSDGSMLRVSKGLADAIRNAPVAPPST
ncbi:SGNH/GDSL hydrolase family protein [Bradyrhizobium sp. Ai1a-2]|uniref:SGNH/GDSL hydrolase family protein n=1 Tax=Bradyrhizobium sp. Ai1a-2 TaxID=196490 RepID=UPI001FCA69B9|nr:SGNH/GDSL hydrolase family protein [Bradyrhizobium sp. Ai1a-2]